MRMGQIARKAMMLGTSWVVIFRPEPHEIPQAGRVMAETLERAARPDRLTERRLITAMRKLGPDLAAMLENLTAPH